MVWVTASATRPAMATTLSGSTGSWLYAQSVPRQPVAFRSGTATTARTPSSPMAGPYSGQRSDNEPPTALTGTPAVMAVTAGPSPSAISSSWAARATALDAAVTTAAGRRPYSVAAALPTPIAVATADMNTGRKAGPRPSA